MSINLVCDIPYDPVYVSTPFGESVVVTYVYPSCSVLFMNFQTWVILLF